MSARVRTSPYSGFRNLLFQLHWLLGISAGLVLALVGATGALLSFEHAAVQALDPSLDQVQPAALALSPSQLVERLQAQRPHAILQTLALSSDPHSAVDAGLAPPDGGAGRGERVRLDPYTGALLPPPPAQAFFRDVRALHRWLLAGEVGKQVVGASTVALLYFCLSGLYLRWPRGGRHSWRIWLALDWRRKGRAFLWQLHAVTGTWVLLAYLVMASTGLWWSYGWYRAGLQSLAGMPTATNTAVVGAGSAVAPGAASVGTDSPGAESTGADSDGTDRFDPDAAWNAFTAEVPDWRTATLRWPDPGAVAQVRYLDAGSPHERASSTLELHPATLAVLAHDRYEQRPLAQRVVGSMFALHRGSFFGLPGVLVFMLASVLMPVFAVSGWMLYLERRRRKRAMPVPDGAALATGRS